MGIFNKLGNGINTTKGILNKFTPADRCSQETEELDKIIEASDNGEEWAHQKFDELWDKYENDPSWLPRLASARIRIYQSAAEQGDKKAQYWMGFSLRRIDKQQALRWLLPLTQEGNVEAMKAIASGYTEFGGFGDDESQYLYWYRMAAEAGDAEAQSTVGLQYRCQNNYREAGKWYQMAAKQKDAQGLLGLAECYEQKQMEEEFQARKETLTPEKERILQSRRQQYQDRIEELRLEALNCARSRRDFAEACHDLGHFYNRLLIGFKGNIEEKEDIAKRAAYFLYNSYLEGENEYDLQQFQRTVSEQRIQVDTRDIETWARREIPGMFQG